MTEQKEEKLMELYITAILNFQNAEESVILERSTDIDNDLEELQKEVNEAIDEFKTVLYNEEKGDCE